jgi:KaiC/GvpD/RAD55 family RecA-like ATPase
VADVTDLLAATAIPAALRRARVVDGATFVFDTETEIPAVWGDGPRVAWSRGESLWITGPPGTGKSTLAQQLVRGRLGLVDQLLGMNVELSRSTVLYIAADRPPQIARSMRRMFTEAERSILRDRLRVHRGALPFDLVKAPGELAAFAIDQGADTLIVDSVKDIATPLTSDEVGAAVTAAFGATLEAGCEVIAVHHHRKASADNRKPSKLADVFGSAWLTAGAGSVITLWGEPGDPLVDLVHLKPPAEEVGPFELEHDHQRGTTTLRERPDEWSLLSRSGNSGVTAKGVAEVVYGRTPSKADTEKSRRRLERFVEAGHAHREQPQTPNEPTIYRMAA